MKRFNIVTKKVWTGSDGAERKSWNAVGTLVHFPEGNGKGEGYKLELSMFPDTQFFVFEQNPKEGSDQRSKPSEKKEGSQEEEINAEDIPF